MAYSELIFSKDEFSPDHLDWDLPCDTLEKSKFRLCYLTNEAISQLRYRAVKQHVPITFTLLSPKENCFVLRVVGFPMLVNEAAEESPLQFHIKIDFTTNRRHLDVQFIKLDQLINKHATVEDYIPDLAMKNYMVRSFKPSHANNQDVIGSGRIDAVTKNLHTWLKRQKVNQLWDISITLRVKSNPDNQQTISVRRTGWCDRAKTVLLKITASTKWSDLHRFQHRLLRLEMTKQQLTLNAQRDTEAAVTTLQTYLDTVTTSYKFWCHALHQWHNQTWTRSEFAMMDPRRASEIGKTYLLWTTSGTWRSSTTSRCAPWTTLATWGTRGMATWPTTRWWLRTPTPPYEYWFDDRFSGQELRFESCPCGSINALIVKVTIRCT